MGLTIENKAAHSMIDGDDITLTRSNGTPPPDFFPIIRPYFDNVQDEQALRAFCMPSGVGEASFSVAYWKGKPAGCLAVFPVPYWIDGKCVPIGKPEFAALHTDVACVRSRPDIFGLLIRDAMDVGRSRGWPLLIGLPNALSRKSHCKQGYRAVSLAKLTALWPLSASACRDNISGALTRRVRMPYLAAKMAAGAMLSLMATCTRFASLRHSIEAVVLDTPNESVRRIMMENSWPEKRVCVASDPDYLLSRFSTQECYKLVSLKEAVGRPAAAAVRFGESGMYVLDFFPRSARSDMNAWNALFRFALSRQALFVSASFYSQEVEQMAALRLLRRSFPAFVTRGQTILVAHATTELGDIYDPGAWGGTDMYGAGF